MKKIIIMGATSGIGHELAKIYIRKGWRVGIAGRRQDLLSSFKEKHNDQVEFEVIDVQCEDAPKRLLALINKLGGLDIYLHSSGIGYQNIELNINTEVNTAKTNVVGFTQLIDTVFHYFQTQTSGHIAVISSIAGTKGLGVAPAYSATKRFQNTYIDALEQLSRLKKIRIDFTDIKPGFVRTELIKGGKGYPLLMQPDRVALIIDKALERKKRRVIIDWRYKLIVFFWKLIPASLWKHLPIKNR